MQRRAKIKDVAKQAGVSPAVVSTVVNNRHDAGIRVSAETRARVLETIHELGYVPNPVARNLAQGKTQLLGVFTYEAIFPIEQSNFFHPFLIGIEQEAEVLGFDLLLFTRSDSKDGKRSVFQQGVNRLQLADGAILFGQNAQREEVLRLQDEGYPFVYIGRLEVDRPVAYVAADYVSAALEVINYLFRSGHYRIAYLGHETRSLSFQDREAGYRRAYATQGLVPDPALISYHSPESLREEHLKAWLAAGMTALVCENHRLATALLGCAENLGLCVPKDFSFALLGDHSDPLLEGCTTFEIPRYDMGVTAVQLLVSQLSGQSATSQTFSCRFVPGRSVREIANRDGGESST